MKKRSTVCLTTLCTDTRNLPVIFLVDPKVFYPSNDTETSRRQRQLVAKTKQTRRIPFFILPRRNPVMPVLIEVENGCSLA